MKITEDNLSDTTSALLSDSESLESEEFNYCKAISLKNIPCRNKISFESDFCNIHLRKKPNIKLFIRK